MEQEKVADLIEMIADLTTEELAVITELGLVTLSEINSESLANSFASMAFAGTHSEDPDQRENYKKFAEAFAMAIVILQNQLYIHKWTEEVLNEDTTNGKKTVH